MHIGKMFTTAAVTAFMTVSSAAFSLSACATTVDDVAAVARSYGYSEADIQAGYNAYYANPSAYPSDILDMAIDKLHEAGAQIITAGPQDTNVPAPTTTTTAVQNDNNNTAPTDSNNITLTAGDGTTFTRISREEFIKMSYDDKMAYMKGFTQAQQQAIIDDLSPAEYRSLMKQSPTDQKLQIVGKLSEAAEQLGLNVTVDEITDDSLTIAMRNGDGELVNVSTAGTTVEDTGYDRRWLIALAAAIIGTAVGALCLLMRRMKSEGTEQ